MVTVVVFHFFPVSLAFLKIKELVKGEGPGLQRRHLFLPGQEPTPLSTLASLEARSADPRGWQTGILQYEMNRKPRIITSH